MAGARPSKSTIWQMPAILYGTAWKDTRTTELVTAALVQGFRGVDTAGQRKHYREDLVGVGLRDAYEQLGISRYDVWIQTKYTPISGQDTHGFIPYDTNAPIADQVFQSFRNSIAQLHHGEAIPDIADLIAKYAVDARNGTPDQAPLQPVYVDSYLLHSPLETMQSTLEAWRVLEALVDVGVVREIGFSNVYDPEIYQALFQAARIKPSILQNRWHHSTGHDVSLLSLLSPLLSPNDFPLLDGALQPRGITYQPFWTLTGNTRLLESTPVAIMASKYNLTPSQVVYAFVHQGLGLPGLCTCVLSGTKNEEHMREAVQAVDSPPWTKDELASLRIEVYGE
ncbi:hypothetical protein MVES1_000008 [Malassezia vespertilionis]|uniref:uncharacterized protein n=1 Tax=Malassezia vespertilionis TaxID=2020962 RepID=UPI0024B1FAF5|nr:uncharacterized protein MVES1_000008 [Malassezia vespertilionis]WFD04685.1 hypothetical protein MVES1_000008 [Malassezia vespertilionis]